MKRFKLHGNSANWKNGLRMSSLNLSTLTEEVSSPIPADSRMFVSVANNVFHVEDTRREIINGELSDEDKNAILSRIKNDTPDFLLTLEDKVVGYACLHYRKDGKRVNAPALDEDAEMQLTCLKSNLAHGLIDVAEFNETKDEILSEFAERVVKPIDGAILLIAEVVPLAPKHSFKKDGLTDAQKDAVYDKMRDMLFKGIFPDWGDATDAANELFDDVVADIAETADWEGYKDDEICDNDVQIAVRRVLLSRITA